MNYCFYIFLICLLICSCSKEDKGNFSSVETIKLSEKDHKAILTAIYEYDKTTNVMIVSTEDWGKTEGKTEYKIKVDNPSDAQAPLAYWLIKENDIWKVTSREL
jgi:hypothetical protein